MLGERRLEISAVAYYDNNLHPDPEKRRAVNDHVLTCVDAAALLGCTLVGTFIGRDPTKERRREPARSRACLPASCRASGRTRECASSLRTV